MGNPSIDEIAAKMTERWNDTLNTERNVIIGTGREGAIHAEVMLLKFLSPDRSEGDIRKEVEAKVWEDGQYEIGGNPYIKYGGLHDLTHADGFFGIVRHGRNYVERWQGGARIQYRIVDDEEFNKLKAESNEHTE